MSFVVLLCLSIGISMDAFSASITDGMLLDKINFRRAIFISVALGIFLSTMPLAGFFLGNFLLAKFSMHLERYSEKIIPLAACVLICILGLRMLVQGIAENINKRTEKKIESISPDLMKEKIKEKMTLRLVLAQSMAISLETLLIGISISILRANIFSFAALTLVITSVLCFFGIFIGKRLGDFFTDKADFFGGVILIAISVKKALLVL